MTPARLGVDPKADQYCGISACGPASRCGPGTGQHRAVESPADAAEFPLPPQHHDLLIGGDDAWVHPSLGRSGLQRIPRFGQVR
jgi:hypothetical protein